jgi:quercetin dioxygenase-like cupin family protein
MVRLQWLKVQLTPMVLSALFLIMAAACGTEAAVPTPTATLAPSVAPPLAATSTEQGLTREGIGRGAGNVKEPIQIEAGQTDLRVGKTTLAPGGYLSWHYHDGPALFIVVSGTVTVKHADGATEDYSAGSAFFEQAGQGDLHRYDNNGNVDAVLLITLAIPGGPPDQAPSMKYVPDPMTK